MLHFQHKKFKKKFFCVKIINKNKRVIEKKIGTIIAYYIAENVNFSPPQSS